MIHVHLVTADHLFAGLLTQYLATWYRVTVAVAEGERCVPDGLSAAGYDAVLFDARELSPAAVVAAIEAVAFTTPVALIAPCGLRTGSIPERVGAAVTHLCPVTEIRIAIEELLAGRQFRSRAFHGEERCRYWQGAAPPTPEQAAVFVRKQAGMSVRDIAKELGLEPKTVEGHVTALRRGLGVPKGDVFDWRDGRL